MRLVIPKLVVLDSATLGKVSRDYWSPDEAPKAKARAFVARLVEHSVFVAVTMTHVSELLRHNDDRLVRHRLAFLRALPFIAWLRPYDRNWFPGGIPDLWRRELHAVVYGGKRGWRSIVDSVRADLWETGTGAEMFDNDRLWFRLRQVWKRQHRDEKYIASIARTDPGQMSHLTIAEVEHLPRRSKEDLAKFIPQFVANMQMQLERHGDRRLESPQRAAFAFSRATMHDVDRFETAGGDPLDRMLEHHEIPKDLMTLGMTVADLGQLAIYTSQLKLIGGHLEPPAFVTIRDVPPDTLPSFVLQRRLSAIQRDAVRVSGSDLGDGHIAPLTLYVDGLEVDKRTCEFLKQIQRADESLAALMQPFFRSTDYGGIPDRFAPVP